MFLLSEKINVILKSLRSKGISVKYDDRDTLRPGAKFAEYELKGVPIRIAMGNRDLENNTVEVSRRDTLKKQSISQDILIDFVAELLEEIQNNLFNNALDFRNTHITEVNSFEEFKNIIENKGGFVAAHWDGTSESEEKIKELTKATIRCIPNELKEEAGNCVFSGKTSTKRVLFAKAY